MYRSLTWGHSFRCCSVSIPVTDSNSSSQHRKSERDDIIAWLMIETVRTVIHVFLNGEPAGTYCWHEFPSNLCDIMFSTNLSVTVQSFKNDNSSDTIWTNSCWQLWEKVIILLQVGFGSHKIEELNLLHVFVVAGGYPVWKGGSMYQPLSLKPGNNSIALLSSLPGLWYAGPFYEKEVGGLSGSVMLQGIPHVGDIDLTHHEWIHQVRVSLWRKIIWINSKPWKVDLYSPLTNPTKNTSN